MKNYMEDVVLTVYEDFKRKYPAFCACERCKADTVAIALTKLRGRYAVSPEGEIFAKLSRDDRQVRADALMVLMEAAKIVAQQPNHNKQF